MEYIDAAEYKHIVLGSIFLRYISDAFEALHAKLKSGKGDLAVADPEDMDEVRWNNEGSFLNDAYKDLKADLRDKLREKPN